MHNHYDDATHSADNDLTNAVATSIENGMLDTAATSARPPLLIYTSYATFFRVMKHLKERGLPRKLESRNLQQYFAHDAARVIAGFLAIGLLKEHGYPTPLLKKLVATFATPEWVDSIREVIDTAYSFVPKDLEDTTSKEINKIFADHLSRDEQAVRNSVTFFLCMADNAGANLSSALAFRSLRGLREARRVLHPDESELDNKDNVAEPQASATHVDDIKPAMHAQVKQSAQPLSEIRAPASGQADRIRNRIVVLTAMLGDTDNTTEERDAIIRLLSLLGRRMNAA